MGYSHSWMRRSALDPVRFTSAAEDCRRACQIPGINLKGIEGLQEPVFQPQVVAFDGGGEWFVVQCICDKNSPERPMRDRAGWHIGFCKTNHMAYDICVRLCLVVLSHHLAGDFCVQSDGNDASWDQVRRICQQALGYGLDFRLQAAEGPAT